MAQKIWWDKALAAHKSNAQGGVFKYLSADPLLICRILPSGRLLRPACLAKWCSHRTVVRSHGAAHMEQGPLPPPATLVGPLRMVDALVGESSSLDGTYEPPEESRGGADCRWAEMASEPLGQKRRKRKVVEKEPTSTERSEEELKRGADSSERGAERIERPKKKAEARKRRKEQKVKNRAKAKGKRRGADR